VHTMVVEREGKIESEKHCVTTPATSHGKHPRAASVWRACVAKREWFQAQKNAFPTSPLTRVESLAKSAKRPAHTLAEHI
jgi:hypothetical protein